ncbi:hypothetical protein QNE24_004067 [Vibrio alginolyticus]|nr:hypothetical protein [Vibrio alginolyticus]
MKLYLLLSGLASAIFFSSVTFSSSLSVLKRGLDTYITIEDVINKPNTLLKLNADIYKIFYEQASYVGLSNDLLIDFGVLDKDTNPEKLNIRTIDTEQGSDSGYEVRIYGVREKACIKLVREYRRVDLFTNIKIFDNDDAIKVECQGDRFGYIGNNVMVFEKLH